ncbi:MAG: amidohydrolase family protein, partial [Verrucomicrobiota bacterium]
MSDTLYRDGAVLTMNESEAVYSGGWMRIGEDGYIKAIGEGEPGRAQTALVDEVVSLEGKIVMPGFVSGHSHLWQSAFRGLAADGELWPWLQSLHWTYGDDLERGDLKAFTSHGAWDQLCHGVTTTYNHTHWLDHGYEMFLEQLEAEMSVPQRFIFSSCVNLEDSPEVWREQLTSLKEKLKPGPKVSLLGVALNLRSFGPASTLEAQVSLAEELDLDFQMHYLEQSGRQDSDRAAWPRYKLAGIPSERATFAHFIHTSE